MKAVLLVGHGSRKKTSNEQFVNFAHIVGQKCETKLFRYAFLELAVPSILDEVKICVEKGAKEIVVFPLLLLSAGHAKHDIPEVLKKAKKLYPNIKFQLENPLGRQNAIFNILQERLVEKQFQIERNSLVIFVGRGSFDKEAIAEFTRISDHLGEKLLPADVQCCFLVGGEATFEDEIKSARQSSYQHIYILPYLLFNGILFKRIQKSVSEINDQRFIVSETIGSDQRMVELVARLINQAL
ncbi:hypothetical protein BKP35_01620 [Anaerobacillus arseniciselenatis]|uniref:Sirohydrochlorin chelatase n=1 Tax=Anaerobacillus arseniciselenatis TaxID=85682 RepID=A0A1S2LVN3_9BACI|nr:sirohydrochlorin chelatase [Anaerobacillus arseniciselenatis]OIJ15717.1 hypothetical protein BKP35_01620 [Anaerobacillus arseniciselenatis]